MMLGADDKKSKGNGPSKSLLEMAKYVAINSSTWVAAGILEDRPPEWNPNLPNDTLTRTTKVQRVIADSLLINDSPVIEQTLQRGNRFFYPKTGVQGLTPVTGNPLLIATMAPDQYILPVAKEIDPETISALAKIASDDQEVQAAIVNDEDLKKILIRDAMYSTGPNSELSKILEKHGVKWSPQLQVKLMNALKKFLGNEHINATSAHLKGHYAVLSIVKTNMTEAEGYDLTSKSVTQVNQSKHTDEESKKPTFVEYSYNSETSPLQRQMVMLSQSAGVKLNGSGSDMESLIGFYDNTIGKGIPLAVHCMDGVDRTGIMITALSILHQFKTGNDITEKTVAEQRQILLDLRESLRNDRGPSFCSLPEDAARGVVLGYLLISVQKQMTFQNNANFTNPALSSILEKVKSNEIEPAELISLLNSFDEPLSKNEKIKFDEWRAIVEQRISAEEQYSIANNDKYTEDFKTDVYFHESTEVQYKTKPIEKAGIDKYNKIIAEGKYDIQSYKDKNGKGIFHYATQTFLSDPSLENLKQMGELIRNGKRPAILAVEQTLIENKMDQRLIGMALQVLENKKNIKAIKSELSSIGTAERTQLLQQLANLSRFGDKDSKKIFKQLNDALPNKSKAKRNDIEMNARVTQAYTSTTPSSGQSEKAADPSKDNETVVEAKGPKHSEKPQHHNNVVRQIISGWNYNYKGTVKELSEEQKASMATSVLEAKPKDTDAVPLSDQDYSALAISVSYALPANKIFEELAQMRIEIFKKPIPDNEIAKKELQDEKSIFLYNTTKFIGELIKADPYQTTYGALNKYLVAKEEDRALVLAEFQARKEKLDSIPVDRISDKKKNELNQIEILLEFHQIVAPQPTDLVEDKAGFTTLITNIKSSAEVVIETKEENEKISKKLAEDSSNEKAFNIDSYLHSTLSHMKIKPSDMQANAAQVAQDLKNRQLMMFMEIDPKELTKQGWSKGDKEERSPNVLKLIQEFNNISSMVQEDLLTAKSQVHQQNIFNFYVILLDQCMQQKNYHSAMAILSAFTTSQISRLTYLTTDKKMMALLASHEKTLNMEGSYKQYRELIADNNDQAFVPYVGLSLADLTFTEDGNPDTRQVANPAGGIDEISNLEKLTLIGKLIQNVTKQSINHNYLRTVEGKEPLQQTNVASRIRPEINVGKLYERSLKIFPRGAKEFTADPEVVGKGFREVETPVRADFPSDTVQSEVKSESDTAQPTERKESDAVKPAVRRESDTVQPTVKSGIKSKFFSKLRGLNDSTRKSTISPESRPQPPATKTKSPNSPEQSISSQDSMVALKSAAKSFSKHPSKENLDEMIRLEKTILNSRSSTQSMLDTLDELGMNIAPSISEEVSKAIKSELKGMGSKERAAAHRLLKESVSDKNYKKDKSILKNIDTSLPSKRTARKNDEIISKNDEAFRAKAKKSFVDNEVGKLKKDYEDYKLNKLDQAQVKKFSNTIAVYSNINDPNSEIRAAAIAIRTEILNSRSEQKEAVKTQTELGSPLPSVKPSSPLSNTPELEKLKEQLIKGLTSIAAATSEDKQIINYYISQFEDKINLSAVNKYVDELRDHLKYNTNHKDYLENKFSRSIQLTPIHQKVQDEIKNFKDAVVVAENKMKSPVTSAQNEDEKAWEGVEVDLDNLNQKLPSGVPIQTVPVVSPTSSPVISSAVPHPQDHSLPSTPKGGRPPSVVFNHVHPDPVKVSTPSVRRQLPLPPAEQVVKAICAQLNTNKKESALPVQWNGIIKMVEEHANNEGLTASEKLGEIKKYLEDNIVNNSRPVPPNIKSKITEMLQKMPIEAVLKTAEDDKKSKLRK